MRHETIKRRRLIFKLHTALLRGTSERWGAFLTYGAVKRLLNNLWGLGNAEPQESQLLTAILTVDNTKGIITKLYKLLLAEACSDLTQAKTRWDAVLPSLLPQKTWAAALSMIKNVSRNTRLRYTQFNYIHHSYLSPARIKKIYPSSNPACPRCATPAADFYHMVWSCHPVNTAWQRITDTTADIAAHTIAPTPESCLLGICRRDKGDKHLRKFIDLAFVVYKRLIATHWKAPHALSYAAWLRDLHSRSQAEAQTLRQLQHRGLIQGGAEIWDNFVVSIEARDYTYPP
ncbi:hypothetical protein NDU88_007903 [Pleurodeles waltl]|uniref:Reverse transcriptase zinc-binding domain-containing protein n=1 Tax=Pleurodeles waltl TaxID=8319 RepID=A0AAV7PRB9_PLEWA|nr:hypothetical protein NDU88_007903 [Pleurodeles waltl]